MPQVAQLTAKVSAEGVETTERQLKEVGETAKETKEHFKGLKDALSTAAGFAIFGAGMAGFGLLKDQISDVIRLTSEFQQTQAQTVQVLKSTHDVSGMTAESLDALAQAYGKTTMFSADTVQSGENLLLTFTNIGKSVFPQATQAILDVSQAMGQDLKSSAIQVGKALGDPTTGMTALQRIGVTFDAQEKEQIKTMMKHNDIIGAQKVILHELAVEFGGSATAAGKTFSGQMEILGHQFDEIKIKLGTQLLPVLSDLLNKYVVPLAAQFSDWMIRGGGLNDFRLWIKDAVNLFEEQLLPDFNLLLNQAIIPLANAFYQAFIQSGLLSNVFQTLLGIFQTIVPLIGQFVGWMQQGSAPAEAVKVALLGIGGALLAIKTANAIQGVIQDIGKLGEAANAFITGDGAKLLNFFSPNGLAAEANTSATLIEGDLATVGASADATAGDIALVGSSMEVDAVEATGALGTITGLFTGLLGIIGDVAGAVMGLLGPIGGLLLAFSTVPDTLAAAGNNNWWNKIKFGGHDPMHLHAHASGLLNNPMGHWATVGEQGPEMMYVPGGASILPNGVLPGGGNGQINVAVYLDGALTTAQLMPHIVDAIRYQTGVRSL